MDECMKLFTFFKNIHKKIKNYYLDNLLKKRFASLADEFDEIYNVTTEGLDANNYGAVRASAFNEIMEATSSWHEKQWFIDIGSGKGRALLLAALRPFQKIIGIEIKYDFCKIAKENIQKAEK